MSGAAADQGKRSSVHDFALSNVVNLDPPEQGYSSDEEEFTGRFTQAAKSRWKSASVCQEEYDLLKPEHIRNYLPEGFGKNKSMSDWIGSNNYWKREWVGGAGLWPFGYALDRSEAANSTLHDARKLFIEAEDRDTEMNSVSDMYDSKADDARRALDATHGGLGLLYATNLRNKKLEHLFARMQVVSGQLALLQNKKLPFRDVTVSGSPYQYAALSYRWGKLKLLDGWECIKDPESPDRIYFEKIGRGGKKEIRYDRPDATKLTARNAAMLYRPNSLKQKICTVPKTIRDAIDVTRDVGVKYLWVDQLCTMQSGNDADKRGNIERMDSIYGHALFTIVAADGLDANAGLKGVGCARGAFKQVFEEEIIPGVHMFLPVNIKMDLQLWEERAWCFQEKVLSKRLLVFTGGFAV
ncbi:hypothetical protein N0V87_009441, partial [Didymella glomerata]